MTLRQRQPRQRCEAFLAFVRSHRCCACLAPPPVQAAHLRSASPPFDKRATGMGEKPDDRWAVPLCRDCHLDDPHALHRTSEVWFFSHHHIDPHALANRLWWEFVGQRTGLGDRAKPPPRKRARRTKRAPSRPVMRRKWPSRPFPKGRKLRSKR